MVRLHSRRCGIPEMTTSVDLDPLKIGDTFIQPWQFLNEADDTPIPQAGNTYKFTLKVDPNIPDDDAAVYVVLVVLPGSAADNGILTVRVEKSETLKLVPTTYHYELKRIVSSSPEDIEVTLYDGKIRVKN